MVLSDLTFADNGMSSSGFKLTHSVEISYFVIDVLAQTARPGDSLVPLPPSPVLDYVLKYLTRMTVSRAAEDQH